MAGINIKHSTTTRNYQLIEKKTIYIIPLTLQTTLTSLELHHQNNLGYGHFILLRRETQDDGHNLGLNLMLI